MFFMLLFLLLVFPSSDGCDLPENIRHDISQYRSVADHIFKSILHGQYKGDTYNSLSDLLDRFGPRNVGSVGLHDSIDYLVKFLQQQGLDNVHTEPALVPHWVRGKESATLLKPYKKELNMLGLGFSVGTSPDGITAEVMVVNSFEDLEKRRDEAAGKIVVFNPTWRGYFKTVKYRFYAVAHASRVGAVATLVRSMTNHSLGTPHTGNIQDSDEIRQIPAACITVEDAAMLDRMAKKGMKIVIHLYMEAKNLPKKESWNTIGEIIGRERPDQLVIVDGHIDTWDNTNGAMDDGGGIAIAWSAARVLRGLNLQPRRTVRFIFFTAEEFGGKGGDEYFKVHKDEAANMTFILESDYGIFPPLMLYFAGTAEAQCVLEEVLKLTVPILNITEVVKRKTSVPTVDMRWFAAKGVPSAALGGISHFSPEKSRYFWYHHSVADNLLIYTPENLDVATALWTLLAYVVADMKEPLPYGNGLEI